MLKWGRYSTNKRCTSELTTYGIFWSIQFNMKIVNFIPVSGSANSWTLTRKPHVFGFYVSLVQNWNKFPTLGRFPRPVTTFKHYKGSSTTTWSKHFALKWGSSCVNTPITHHIPQKAQKTKRHELEAQIIQHRLVILSQGVQIRRLTQQVIRAQVASVVLGSRGKHREVWRPMQLTKPR